MPNDERKFEDASQEELDLEKKPLGENNLSSFAMFNERDKYKKEVYPIYGVVTPYDLWYDPTKHYLGKLDTQGNALITREKYLKQLPGSVNAFALDFVVDAFNDFKQKYVFLNKRISEGTPFNQLDPTAGWRSSPVDYNDYLDNVFDLFAKDYMTQNKRDQKVIDFKSFLNEFYKFVKNSEGNMPITFSGFIKSNFCSPKSSGLMIEISDDPYSNDADKYDNFIKDINFECYVNTAAEFGFRVDKNFPGRLIADVTSDKMQQYMSAYPKEPTRPEISIPEEPVFELPEISSLELDSPWASGDTVEIVMVIPEDPNDSYVILEDYTKPKNQQLGAGVRPKINAIAGEEVSEYDYLVEELIGNGRATKIFLKLVTPPNPGALPRGMRYALVIGVENSFPREVNEDALEKIFRGPGRPIDIYRTSFNEYLEDTVRDDPNIPGSLFLGIPFYQNNNYYLQVPEAALHLSNAVQQPYSTIQRFNEFFRERDKLNLERQRRIEYRQFVYDPLYKKYQEELKTYEKTIENYETEKRLYDTLPKPMSYYNFVDARYNLGYRVDVDMLKEMLMQFYYSYSSSKPFVFLKEDVYCGTNTPRTKSYVLQREQISKSIIDKKYPQRQFWIKTYAEMKNLELKNKIKKEKFNQILRNAISTFNSFGEEESLKYISEEFKNHS
jgi:hypothetical protein